MKVISVNVGQPRDNPWKTMKLTGIDKRPVEGPVMVTPPRAKGMGLVGLAGDRVYDVRNHGGPDQAVYAYTREDMDFWADELDLALPNGVFGENLTTEGADANGALIGERWRVGPTLVLEATGPRVPCGTFQGWLAQAGWIKRFALAGLARTSGSSSRARSRPGTRSRSCSGPIMTSPWPWSSGRCWSSRNCSPACWSPRRCPRSCGTWPSAGRPDRPVHPAGGAGRGLIGCLRPERSTSRGRT